MSDTPIGFPADSYIPILSWPASVEPAQFSLQLVANSTSVTSPFTGAMQAEPMAGSCWSLAASFTSQDVDQARAARSAFAQLNGCAGRFYFLAEPGEGAIAPQPVGDAVGAGVDVGPRVQSTSGGLLQTFGWQQAPGELVARLGDYISVDDAKGWRHLFMLTEDCIAGEGGTAEFAVLPELAGVNLPENGPLHFGGDASGVFYLTNDEQGVITETPGDENSFSISAAEFKRAEYA